MRGKYKFVTFTLDFWSGKLNDKKDKKLTPVGYFTLVRENTNFRTLWFGQIISLFGDWFNLIASAALVSYLTKSGLAVGGLFVVRMLAPFLASPIAGVVADRYNRKYILIAADCIRAVIVIGFLFVRDVQHVWLLYTLTALQLGVSGFFFPARNAILPDITSRAELGTANALSSSTWSVMLALGAALGGLVIGSWGIYPAFLIDSFTFLLSAVFIYRLSYKKQQSLKENGQSLRDALNQYIDGLRYLIRNKGVLAITLHKGAFALMVSGAFQVIQVTLAEKHFPVGVGGGISLGLMYAVAGVGTGIGPIIARIFTKDRGNLLRFALAGSYAVTIIGLAITAPLVSFNLVLLGTFLRAFGGGINWVFSTQLLLQILPDDIRGRVFSTEFAIFTLSSATGTATGGWLLDKAHMNITEILILMIFATAIPGFLWWMWTVRGTKLNPSSS